jgi:hypothetical protein
MKKTRFPPAISGGFTTKFYRRGFGEVVWLLSRTVQNGDHNRDNERAIFDPKALFEKSLKIIVCHAYIITADQRSRMHRSNALFSI